MPDLLNHPALIADAERPHHPFGPSRMERRAACPASYYLEQGKADDAGDDAIRGRKLHAAVWDDEILSQLPDADQEAVQSVRDELTAVAPLDAWMQEVRVSVPSADGDELLFGYADAVLLTALPLPDEVDAILVDFKFGWIEVEQPADNLQFASLACGLMYDYNLDSVKAVCIQPTTRPTVTSHTYSNYDALWYAIAQIIATCMEQGPSHLTLRAGADHCRYCRARFTCPAYSAIVTSMAEIADCEDTALITADNAADLYEKAKMVGALMDGLKDRIKAAAIAAGGELGLLYVQETRGHRYLPDLQTAWADVLHKYLTPDEIFSVATISVPKLEALLVDRLLEADEIQLKKDMERWMAMNAGIARRPSSITTRIRKEK